jgi:hypothetical protein
MEGDSPSEEIIAHDSESARIVKTRRFLPFAISLILPSSATKKSFCVYILLRSDYDCNTLAARDEKRDTSGP